MSHLESYVSNNHASTVLEEFDEDTDEKIQSRLKKVTGLDAIDQIESLDFQITPNDTILSRGCKWLTNLSFLCLSHSNLSSLRNFGTLPSLKVLWISECSLNSLDGLSNNPHIQQLYASYNNISDLYPCIFLEELSYLDVEGNQVSDVTNIESLVLCPCLKSLTLQENPICYATKKGEADFDYCETVKMIIPQLEILDGIVTSSPSHLPSCKSSQCEIKENSITKFINAQDASPEIYGSCPVKCTENDVYPRSSSPNIYITSGNSTSLTHAMTKSSSTESSVPSPNHFYRMLPSGYRKVSSPCSISSSDSCKMSSPCSSRPVESTKISSSCSRPSSSSSKISSSCSRPPSAFSDKHLKSAVSVDSLDEIITSNLSEDYSSSLSCSGQVFCGNPGRAFRSLRSSSASTSLSRDTSDDDDDNENIENHLKEFWPEITEDNFLQNKKNQNNKKRNETWPLMVNVNKPLCEIQPKDILIHCTDFSYEADISSLSSTFPSEEVCKEHYLKNMTSSEYHNLREHLNHFQKCSENKPYLKCEMQSSKQLSEICETYSSVYPGETFHNRKNAVEQIKDNCQEISSCPDDDCTSIYSLRHDLMQGLPSGDCGTKYCDLIECARETFNGETEAQNKKLVLESAVTTWKRIEDTGLGQKLPNNRLKSSNISL